MKYAMLAGLICTSVLGVAGRASADTAAGPADTGLEEIVVTAQRRAEDLQRVAIPVDVVSGNKMLAQGIVQAEDLNKLVPDLAISANGAYPQLYLRGLGTFGNVLNDSSVLPSLDGVPLGTGSALRGAFYDLARVEVLKGPQGTLYGLNAAAGAINVISNKPGKTLGGDASIDIGNYSDFKFEGAVNLPVTDTLAFRMATQIVNRAGYLSDGGSDDHHQSLRFSALYTPIEPLSVLFVADYTRYSGRNYDYVPLPLVDPSNPWLAASTPLGNSRLAPYAAVVPLITDQDKNDSNSYGVHAEINWDLDFATLSVVPAFRKTESSEVYEPGFFLSDNTKTEQASGEVRLASNGNGANKWLVGAYYFNGLQDLFNFVNEPDVVVPGNPATLPARNGFFLDTKTYAFFGTDTYSVTDAFRVTAGIRYTDEKREGEGTQVSPPPTLTYAGQTANRNVSGKVGVEWDVAPRSLLYANVSNAVRAGGINPDSAPNTYEPEKLTAYTIGSKNALYDGRLRLNAELYYWNDKDHQEDVLAERNIGGLDILSKNVNKVVIKGVDVDAQFYATSDDVLGVSVEHNEAKIVAWDYNSPLPFFVVGPTTGCVTTPGAVTNFGPPFGVAPTGHVNCSGEPLTRSPKWTGTVSVQHTLHLANSGSMVGDIDARFATRSFLATDFLPQEEQPGYAVLNASLTYYLPGDRWSVALWGRNLSDKIVYGTTFERPGIGVPGAPDLFYTIPGDPRTYGVSLRVKF